MSDYDFEKGVLDVTNLIKSKEVLAYFFKNKNYNDLKDKLRNNGIRERNKSVEMWNFIDNFINAK